MVGDPASFMLPDRNTTTCLSLGLDFSERGREFDKLRRGRVRIVQGGQSAETIARIDELQIPNRAELLQGSNGQLVGLKF